MRQTPEVHLLAGLNGAGKTTHARRLALELPGVRFSLDEWVLRLHGTAYDDAAYAGQAARCRELLWDTARQVLAAGTDVVLDQNLWSRALRREWRDRALDAGARPVLHHVDVPLDVALARAAARQDPTAHRLDPADVRRMAEELFEPPGPDEGLEVRVARP